MRMLLALLSLRWLSFRNTFRRGTRKESRSARVGILVTIVISAFIGLITYSFLVPFVRIAGSSESLSGALDRMPSFALFASFWMLLLSAVTVSIQQFYLNQEISLLLASPAAPRTIFAAKLAECTIANANLFLILAIPMTVAYASAREILTPFYLIQAGIVILAFSVLPTTCGILLSFMLMRVLPANRTRDLLGALGVLAFACVYFVLSVAATRSNNPEILSRGATRLTQVVASPVFRLGPWAWAGGALRASGTDLSSWLAAALLATISAVLIGIALLTADRIFWRGWTSLQENDVSISRVGDGGKDWSTYLVFLSGPIRAVIMKDMRNLRRDLRQLSLLFIPLAVVAVFLFQVADAPIRQGAELFMMAGLLPILAMISLRLAMSAFVAESRAMWLMIGAPNDARTVLLGKFLYAYALAAPLASAATVAYSVIKQLDWGITALSLALTLCAVAGFCGIGVGSSALFTDFAAEPAKAASSAGGRLLTFAFQMGYLTALAVIFGAAWFLSKLIAQHQGIVITIAGLAVLSASAAAILLPISLGANRLRNLEW